MTKRRFGIILFIITITVICIATFVGCNKNSSSIDRTTMPCIASYTASKGGKLRSGEDKNKREKISQLVKYGEDAEEVTATANEGFYFVKWSDGCTSVTRQDVNLTSNLFLEAQFSQITDGVVVKYKTNITGADLNGEGKRISYNEIEQLVQRGMDCERVESQLIEGIATKDLVFWQWSDGVKTTWRHDRNVTESFEVIALYCYPVRYGVKGDGYVIGETEQMIQFGEHTRTVTAMPKEGYRFVEWSDGVKTAERQDKWVAKSIDVYAIFEWRDTDDFVYHYNYATDHYDEDSLTLTRGEVDGVAATVPEREFFTFDGWYLDESFTSKAIDESGNNLLGEEIFNSPSRDLYAKWNVKEEYVVTYKILMVYVTAINGTFIGNDGQSVKINYRMPDDVKRQCIKLTDVFKEALNDMLDGLVNFEVNSFFTTESVDEMCFENEKNDTCIYANQIPELNDSGILDNYRSVITLYSFGGEKNLLTNWSGEGGKKYATVPIDENIRVSGSIEKELEYYNGIVDTCVHEFIHTIEYGITCYDYHRTIKPFIPSDISNKLYLLNQFPVNYSKIFDRPDLVKEQYLIEEWRNSDKAGVPYGYWTNEMFNVIVKPECVNGEIESFGGTEVMDGGSVDHFNSVGEGDGWRRLDWENYYLQCVPKGSRTTVLVARPDKGCKFVGWSDGVQDEVRILTDVQEDTTLIAYFERLSYTVEYRAGEGGRIEGEAIQTLLVGERTKSVTAVADEGYKFVGWSDGWGDYPLSRSDLIGQNKFDENGELYYCLGFSVTAIFEKIQN